MNHVEGEAALGIFEEILLLEKQFTTLLERQTPWAVDVHTLLKQ